MCAAKINFILFLIKLDLNVISSGWGIPDVNGNGLTNYASCARL